MKSKIYVLLLIFLSLTYFNIVFAQLPTNDLKANKVLLPNGWSLSPAGRSLPLGDLPLNMQLSASGNLLAVTNNGQGTQSIQLIDPKKETLLDEKIIAKSWYGLKFSLDEKKLYASGGNDNVILIYPISNKKIGDADTIRIGKAWPKQKISPTGLDVDDASQKLYTVTKENNSLYVIDLKTKKISHQINLGHEAYGCLLSPDRKKLYITLWGGDMLSIYDIKSRKIITNIPTESHPNELICTKNGKYIFIANANDNSVSVINAKKQKVIEIISATLFPTKLTGSTTNGLALSPDEKTLYIANADNNCLAVFNVSSPGNSISKGFIPTGWYPTNVRTVGNKILVANGKGFSSLPNPEGPQPIKRVDKIGADVKEQYIGNLFKGILSVIDVPNDKKLKNYSQQVYANTPFKQNIFLPEDKIENPVLPNKEKKSPIKYVFYIIKENRTYDQVFGDIKEGNGDSSLCLFPEKFSPNHHALAKEFVLLDNFYADAEVSTDGHNWSTAAYATDFVEKTWPTLYGRRGGNYDFEGTRKIAYPKNGFIWDYCKRAGISYRSYGEFVDNGKANVKTLEGHICTSYMGFNLDYKDMDRFAVWKHDFDSLLIINNVPQLSIMRLPNDHTSGQRIGKYSPFAAVGDNDLALGKIAEYISQSSIWNESAIFVLEDDAQNGPDHVDAHRSVAFAISPYIKKGTVDHNMYSTSGFLHTIELILGLPPMSQYDASALPLYDCFTAKPDFNSYHAKPASVDLEQRNTAWNKSAQRSQFFNLSKEDEVPDWDLNDVVWKFVKGENTQMPVPKRSAFIILMQKEKN